MKSIVFKIIWVFVLCLVFIYDFRVLIGSFASCIHGGTKYKDGDYFPPNKTFIETESPEQCVQCRCHRGLVICEIENCPLLQCDNPTKSPQFCCHHCSGILKTFEKSTDFVFNHNYNDYVPSKKKETTDCLSNGVLYQNGSAWQPIIGPFGAMACVRCHCQEGNVVCTRLKCNEVYCSHPRREFGECCPVCPTIAFCIPKIAEVFVFKAPNLSNSSLFIKYAFLENNPNTESVTMYSWNLLPKNILYALTVRVLSRKEWEEREFQFLGSITRKKYKKFSERSEKLQMRCFVQCWKKIRRLENSLRINAAVTKNYCNESEFDVSNYYN